MLEWLIELLTPFFTSLGVSAADINSYIHSLSIYIYIIAGSLLAMIVIMLIVCFVVKKGVRHIINSNVLFAWILLVVVIINVICYGPMYANVSGVLNASRAEISEDVTGNSQQVIKEIGEEGMVLVKNEDLLPLSSDTTNINVFGWASTNPIYSGTGSSSSGSDKDAAIDILTSLRNSGYVINEELSNMYVNYCSERPTISMSAQDWTLPEPTAEYYTDEIMKNATDFSDTALIVIGRSGGENADLPTDMNAVIHGDWNISETDEILADSADNYNYFNGIYKNNGNYDDFDTGEHYLELSNTEEDMIEIVCSSFQNVIVVINANNAMELDWVDKYDSIGAVILVPGTGATGMEALGEIISGSVNPSGKTVDTYVKDLTKTPTWNNFGNYSYTNVDDLKQELAQLDGSFQGAISFVNYVEGIYVGYKFYETAAEEGLISYEDHVQYPFGYGLSYTTFTQQITGFKENRKSLNVEVTVTNTGSVVGKDVVQLYYTPPYTNGGIEKASVNLVDFEKTKELQPGESEKVTFEINLEDMASYDSEAIKTDNGGYVLEEGEYILSVRADSHTILDSVSFVQHSDIDYSKTGRSADELTATNRFLDAEGSVSYLSRADGFANYAEVLDVPDEETYLMDQDTKEKVINNTILGYNPKDYDREEDVMPETKAKKEITLADVAGKDYEDADWDRLLNQMSIDDMVTLINTGGWQTAAIASVGKVATSDCDGPAGLNNYVTGAAGTTFPTEVLMAQTWSKELADKIGDAMGQEFANAENFGWYGPGMNIHRSAFAGRNFEYYSEDGIFSGKFASNQVNGAAKYGVYAYIKHFAANDQETNRCAFLMTYSNEQCLREIVLKPFEIVVKNFDYENGALAVMSAYNWLGTKPCCSNYELLTTVLRDEWGFKGMVITDYNGSYGFQMSEACVRAGNDLMLGYGVAESNEFHDTKAATSVLAMRQACKNILYSVGRSGYYEDAAATNTATMDNMTKTFITIDATVVVIILVLEALLLFLRFRKKKKS